jgi:hypothetical protein
MTWGIPTNLFLQIHVAISLIGIATGLIVLYGLLTGRPSATWTALFLATTVLTSVTGFPLPPFGVTPGRVIGVILLVLLAIAVAALYGFRPAGAWRWVYIGTALAALYRLRRHHAIVSEARVPAAAGADAVGASIPDRAARRARAVHCARRPGSDQVSSRGLRIRECKPD